MTDHADLDRDEIASAILDDEAAAEDPSRLDPDVLARVDRFRAVSEAVADPVDPLTATQREGLLRVALEASVDAPVPLGRKLRRADVRRPGPRRRIWLPPPAIAAAVVLVVALVGIGLIVEDHGNGSSDDLASTAVESTLPTAAERATGGASGPAADSAAAGISVPDLGTFADPPALRTALSAVDPSTLQARALAGASSGITASEGSEPATTNPETGTPQSTRAASPAVNRCDEAVRSTDPTLGARVAVASATVQGREVLIYSHTVQDGAASARQATRITAVDAESCGVVLAVQR